MRSIKNVRQRVLLLAPSHCTAHLPFLFTKSVLRSRTQYTKKHGLLKWERSFVYNRSQETSTIVEMFACVHVEVWNVRGRWQLHGTKSHLSVGIKTRKSALIKKSARCAYNNQSLWYFYTLYMIKTDQINYHLNCCSGIKIGPSKWKRFPIMERSASTKMD